MRPDQRPIHEAVAPIGWPADSPARAIDVLVADAVPDLREILRLLLELAGDIRVVHAAASVAEAIAGSRARRPAVLVIDDDLMRRAGETPRTLRRQLPGTAVLALAVYPGEATSCDGPGVRLLPKDAPPDQLAATVRALATELPTVRAAGPTDRHGVVSV